MPISDDLRDALESGEYYEHRNLSESVDDQMTKQMAEWVDTGNAPGFESWRDEGSRNWLTLIVVAVIGWALLRWL